MNNNNSYQSWLENGRDIELSPEFSKNVLQQISLYERKRRATRPAWEVAWGWVEWISVRPLVRTAVILAGLIAGAARLLATLQIILSF